MASRSVSLVLATSTGGVGAHVRALAEGLAGTGWQVQVCGPLATDALFGFSKVAERFCPIEITAAPKPAAIRQLRHALGSSKIVHAHGLRAATVAVLAGARPLVVTWHNAILDESLVRRGLSFAAARLVARRADISLAASADLAAQVQAYGGRDVRAAPVAITLGTPTRSREDVRAELGLLPGQHLVLSIGRLHRQKALDVLVAAAARWSSDQTLVAIAGDGPLQTQLADQIAATAAPVRLLGRRSDIADLLAAADIVVLASRWEARSLAAQETLLAGRPLVATAVGGTPDLVGDGAVLVPPDDVAALDAAVQALLTDPRARAELAARGQAQARRWPTEADTLAQVGAVYAELLARS